MINTFSRLQSITQWPASNDRQSHIQNCIAGLNPEEQFNLICDATHGRIQEIAADLLGLGTKKEIKKLLKKRRKALLGISTNTLRQMECKTRLEEFLIKRILAEREIGELMTMTHSQLESLLSDQQCRYSPDLIRRILQQKLPDHPDAPGREIDAWRFQHDPQ